MEDPLPRLMSLIPVTATAGRNRLSPYLQFMAMVQDMRRVFRRPRPEIGGERITEEWLKEQDDTVLLWAFRLKEDEILALLEALHMPEPIIVRGGSRFSALEALCLTLARFRSSGDLYELSAKYGRAESAISEVVNWTVSWVDERWGHLLNFDHEHLLSANNLQRYADAIHAAGAPLRGCWGFIDCTIRRICRPIKWQRQAYSGHKKYHALKFQAVMLPNGMFGHLFGGEPGRHNDNHLLAKSRLLDQCLIHTTREHVDEDLPYEEHYFQLFGDPAYGISPVLQSPFPGLHGRTEEETAWNNAMSKVRIEVEHGFGIVSRIFPFLDAGWKMQLFRSPVGTYYRTAVILVNGMNCLHPNQVSQRLNCPPPEITEYFHD
ncbi:putative DDE superfamily endonuclease [Lyophyllum shimeji]|uniref:DDE superfamily endonuclease n=1 Tax=Lyophyllum shimeji TaxID=47721 RepID=A0A9P3PGG6_LYOSH|nr:putative DDE superfamily endonuclease [Lyophyllum shimeji]